MNHQLSHRQTVCLIATIVILLLLTSIFGATAQKSKIEVVPQDEEVFTGERIIQDLVKSGVEILHVKTNFSPNSHVLGFFSDPTRYMGIGQGLILSTGIVDNLTNPSSAAIKGNHSSYQIEDTTENKKILKTLFNDTLSTPLSSYDLTKFAKPGDDDLSKEIDGLQTYDARVIEIQFIPSADTLYYRYVFASEEYDEYVCSEFNDVFAFYLTKEGGQKKNIALVPGEQLPVSINTINGGNPAKPSCPRMNAHLYQRNNGKQNLLFDGFTKVLDIRQKVIPGEVYTLKIAIADASDSVWDSAVMIENGSVFSYFRSFELNFSTNSAAIKDKSTLQAILASLQKHPTSKIQIIGHSDLSGRASYNYGLSVERVKTLSSFLLKEGIAPSRILETYKGETMPRYKSAAKNRRVEVFILGA